MRTIPILLLILSLSMVLGFLLTKTNKTIKVSTLVGDVVGIEETVRINSSFGYKVQKFLGIPYAESPTGNLRFKKPVAKTNFAKTFDAKKKGPVCYQIENPFSSNTTRSEDCLRLDIYTPVTKNTHLKPVMLWIHGGAFLNGGNDMFDGSVLSGFGDVIVVVINYRLAYFGFFTTGDLTSPGNFGLWDQQLAIQWTFKNIQSFGGDPGRITVLGESSGGSSVIFQTFYSGNKGLFKHAIAQSASRNSPWVFAKKSINIESSKEFAAAAGCKQETPADYIACLQALPADILYTTMNAMQEVVAGPVLDHEFILDIPNNLNMIDTSIDPSLEMFHSVDLMIGYNSADGMLDLFSWMKISNHTNPIDFKMPKDLYEHDIITDYIQDYYTRTDVSETARLITLHEYTDWSDPLDDRKRVAKLIDLATDYYLGVSSVQTAARHIKDNVAFTSTYTYEFAIRPLPNPTFNIPVPRIVAGPELCRQALFLEWRFREFLKTLHR